MRKQERKHKQNGSHRKPVKFHSRQTGQGNKGQGTKRYLVQRDIERLGNMQATLTDLSEDLLARIQTLEEKIKKLEAKK